MRSQDSKDKYSDYSSTWKFYTEGDGVLNHVPFLPSLVDPALKTSVNSVNTTLKWTASDVDGDALTFDVYFGDTNTPVKVASNVTNEFYEVNLSAATTYYWKIVVKDESGAEAIGQIWEFETE